MEPYSLKSPGFLNLLVSQSSQSVEFECSEIPRFSSQGSDDPSIRRKWSPKEDVLLISAWLNTSKDPIVSNEQRAGNFWKRIQQYYNSSPLSAETGPREASQCKQRWGRLNDLVCKFAGCYEAALKTQASGQNDNDMMKTAHDIFYNDYKVKFTVEHAWKELQHDQKWSSTFFGKDGVKEKWKNVVEAEGSEKVNEQRPIGVKAAKRRRNGKEEAMAELKSMMDMKAFLNKQKLLDRLLAKKEPLTEIEVTLKNKLIAEML